VIFIISDDSYEKNKNKMKMVTREIDESFKLLYLDQLTRLPGSFFDFIIYYIYYLNLSK